jgi:hypothetical protein
MRRARAAATACEDGQMSPEVRSELRTGLVVVAGSLVAAVLVGILWRVITPLPHLVTRADGVYLTGGEDEVAVAADGWFAICSATVGLVCALVVFARMRQARLGPLLGLALGGLLGAVLAWRLGVALGPGNLRDTAKGLATNTEFDGPLKLSARGVLFAWPLTSTVAYFALTAGLEPKPVPGGDQHGQRFPITVLRPGYLIAEVDDAFVRLDRGELTADEVRGLRFSSSRWRQGYDGTSVDAAVAAAAALAALETPSRSDQDDESARPSLG